MAPITLPPVTAPGAVPAGRTRRDGNRATAAAAGASLPADSGPAGRAAARGAAPTAQDRPAGPEGDRTTGEGA
ncbi:MULTISPECIES: hypothetical protein [unclassified Streptomyces]|uniref:hypothetical protein n=1 Tax=unclassified Streptomyces TaxID=2593676 RepID=UPI002886E839|nr:hypothetical protein [Streptomyces sp. DSM 41633]